MFVKFKLRKMNMIKEINISLEKLIVSSINDLDNDEFIDLIRGRRGNLSFLQADSGSFKLSEENCICGDIENFPCQFLPLGEKCQGNYCKDFRRRQ